MPEPNDEPAGITKTFAACFAGACVPGLGHALLRKWDRALVFFASISIMLTIGILLHGRLFNPAFGDFFPTLKFLAEAVWGCFTGYHICRALGVAIQPPLRMIMRMSLSMLQAF